MNKKYIIFFSIIVAVLVLDQITKFYIYSNMALGDSITVIPELFSITYIKNPGAAFGLLAKAPAVFRSIFFIVVAAAAIILILTFISRNKAPEPLLTSSLALILGGAIGNLVDRIRFGEVVDFLDFAVFSYHWPAFNIADSAISVGAVILLIEIINRRKERAQNADDNF